MVSVSVTTEAAAAAAATMMVNEAITTAVAVFEYLMHAYFRYWPINGMAQATQPEI